VQRSGGAGRGIRVLVTVTFNDNQLRAHLLPIVALPEVAEVVLVTDTVPTPLPKVRVVVPPRILVRITGRAVSKLLVCLRLALRERPDWIIGFNLVPHGSTAILAARAARTRSLYAMIGGDREWREGGWDSDNKILGRLRSPSPVVERALLWLMRRSTYVATMGAVGRAELLKRGLDGKQVTPIPPAIDVERFKPSVVDVDYEYDVITVAALLPNKRVADVIDAAAHLAPRRPGLRVAIVGRGPLDAELRARARRLGLDDVVDFLGFRDDVEALYARSRVFVLPSASEGLSIAMLEAMASGVTPVVTDVGELGSLVRDGETGRLYAPGDVEALATILEELLTNPARSSSLGAAAAELARSQVSVDAVSASYRDLFERSFGKTSS
jgi:glycosyltransferase involved in cell wall biosynthesis